ncbi:MAG TPA: hypothetical protein VM733_09970, partial [Thermoanaerobaculia bacterium]|nr:hypothetical protein [Thermoanaerobaculia bacterium]
MRPQRLLLLLPFLALSLRAAPTRDNESSCDIAMLPAATLLLPYFEVDLADRTVADTRFTIVNVTNADRVAHVTLWTDRAYPVLGFNVPLTGYDMTTISVFDVLALGRLAEPAKARGKYSVPNGDLSTCDAAPLTDDLLRRIRSIFTTGGADDACSGAGAVHARAIGYATIDVVGSCSAANVEQREYWTRDLRYDNVLTGDYEQVSGGDAQAASLVHIRAVRDAAFPRTFYSRYQSADAPRLDARQPLPSRFALHWIQGGRTAFATDLKIWRESVVRADAPCSEFARNAGLAIEDIVRFDEAEN